MRYECQSCGHRFDEPAFHREGCEDYGWEDVSGCPICGGGFISIEERDCPDCVWMAEDGCTSWECEFVSRMGLRKLIKAGYININELIKEVNRDNH